jgi:hypothetical protein
MKTIVVLSVFCVAFAAAMVFLIWYIRKILNELLYISENIGDFLVVIDNYAEHLETVYNMETYYGDETIQGMIEHTKAVVEEISQFESIYSLTTDLEEDTEYEDEVGEEIDDEEELITNSA